MSKPLQERMSITLDELKELEPTMATAIAELSYYIKDAEQLNSVPPETGKGFAWLVTKLYLTAYHEGYVTGGIDMSDRIEARLTRSIKVKK